MWLTSWSVAWLLNFYGFSHTNCMVFYRTPWTRYGIPWNCIGTSGNPMAFHGTPRYSMEFHGIPWNSITTSWNSVELHGIPWNPMDTPWNSMAFGGTPWILHPWRFHGIASISMDFHRFPWNSMDFHICPWISMDIPFHGGIRYFTRDAANKPAQVEISCQKYALHVQAAMKQVDKLSKSNA